MRKFTATIIISLLASCHAVYGQTHPVPGDTKAPTDKLISGVFSPARVESDQEAFARKAEESGAKPFQHGRNYYFLWNAMTPPEFEALARNTLFLISVWTQKSEDFPVKRVYIRADGQEFPVYKVAGWQTWVKDGSLTAKMYGPNREDGFYLVPGRALLKKGQIVLDLRNQTGWVMMELPSNVASNSAQRFPNLNSAPNTKPDLKTLQELIQRRFPGFLVPQSLP
jgi:hypothetical protein